MKRTYSTGEAEGVNFFTGWEVEKTPAFGMHTLFVTGLQPADDILHYYDVNGCEHIFFGANHSFSPGKDYAEWEQWERMIAYFLDNDYLCTLDIPMSEVEQFNDSSLCEYDNFIPQIRVPIPYVKLWNYNTMVKIDDRDFWHSNPGVWCHSLHDLMERKKFTEWSEYSLDTPIKER
jgi:hypothetical protein